MYSIPWEQCSIPYRKGLIADIGDIRLLLIPQKENWELSMGIRVYTTDRSKSMVRPPATVLHIPMPCELEEAKEIANSYFDNFLQSVVNATSL